MEKKEFKLVEKIFNTPISKKDRSILIRKIIEYAIRDSDYNCFLKIEDTWFI